MSAKQIYYVQKRALKRGTVLVAHRKEPGSMDTVRGWVRVRITPAPLKKRKCKAKLNPNAIAEGHNPDRLTNTQVGVQDGWRLLTASEIFARRGADSNSSIERHHQASKWDKTGWSGSYIGNTYRTYKPVGYWLNKEAK